MDLRPIAEGLFRQGPPPCLIGGRRKADGRMVFPMPNGAEEALFEAVPLKTEGALWSFTVQRFRPKSPPYAGADTEQTFKPYAIGYVELEGEVIVETRIVVDDFSTLKIGQPMRLILEPFGKDAVGAPMVTYAFEPIPSASGAST